jgi:hypothetical protein
MANSKSDKPPKQISSVYLYRVKRGDLAYRNRMDRLSPNAKKIVYMFEGASTVHDVIDWLAMQYMPSGSTRPSERAIRCGQVEYSDLIAEIAQVFAT